MNAVTLPFGLFLSIIIMRRQSVIRVNLENNTLSALLLKSNDDKE